MSRFALLAACTLSLVGCRQLPAIPVDVCGNGVIEPPEDCDGISIDGLSCRPQGALGQCRLDCTPQLDGTRTSCPAGFGCDEQNVCRRATGDFRAVATSIPGNARSLLSGDFDGDGRADVVSLETPGAYGFTKARVHYFDSSAAPRATWAASRQVAQPLVARLFDDSRADLAYSTGSLGILSGEPDGSLIPEAYPSYYVPGGGVRMLTVLDTRIDDNVPFLVLATRDGNSGLFRTDGASFRLVQVAELPAGVEAMGAEPIVGDLREDDARFPCLDVALSYRDTREVLLYSVCERDPETGEVRWRDKAEILRLSLEAPAAIDRGLLLADLDGNGHRDLLIGTTAGPHAAFGDGANLGSFRPFPILSSPPGAAPAPMPIAAGQFAGDAAADLVLPDALLVAVEEPGVTGRRYRTIYGRSGSPWSEALVADFNGNGKPDVVAASATRLDLDFFNGAGGDNLNAFTIPTATTVQHLATGDFDGDLISDVAFVQIGSRSAPEGELSIAFGSTSGPPTAPVTAARLTGITQLTPFYAGGDAVSSLLVTADQPNDTGGTTSALSLLIGSGDRSLICPIELTTFAADGSLDSAISLGLTSGSFTDRGRRDLMTLGIYGDLAGEDFGMWLLPDVASRRSAPQSLGRRFELLIRPVVERNSIPEVALRLTAGDLDRNGLDDLVLAAPDASTERCIIGSASVDSNTSRLALREPTILEDSCAFDSQLAAADVDSDSAPDVVLLLGDPPDQTRLIVLWGDGSGALREDEASLVSRGSAPVAFTLLRSTPDAPLRLAYVTDHGVRLGRFIGSHRDFDETRLPTELDQGTGITAADVNGDGVVDLVVADAGTVRVLRAELAE